MEEVEYTEQEREQVLKTFFKDGKLVQMPAQHKKQIIVIKEIAKLFEKNKEYTEFELNRVIKPVAEDFCTIRRTLVDLGVLSRENGVYRLK